MRGVNGSSKPLKIHIETFGCTANMGDTMKLRALLRAEGHELVAEEEAEVVILNTCTVTKRTELDVLKRLREVKSAGKEVIVAGCMAAAQPELIRSYLGESVPLVTPRDISDAYRADPELDSEGVVSIIPIAMGCVGQCSYCVVKQARGELISYAPEKIQEVVARAVERGAKEIRITSQDCSAYGWDRGDGFKLPALLELVTSVEGDFRVRVGMMNPFTVIHLLDELLEIWRAEKIFKFFHVPVQSGSDKVLRDMRRGYTAADFVEIANRIRRRFPDCVLCTDFIIGFPTESEDDFRESLRLLEEVKPEKVNITRFSARPGTEAARLNDLLEREKKRRSRIFSSVERRLCFEKQKALEGKVLPVLITERGPKGGVIGRDQAYRMVILDGDLPLGAWCRTRIKEARSTYLMGEVVP